MKLALLPGNRFNPWHFQGYRLLRGNPDITVFRATSEIQRYFDERNDRAFDFAFERVYFDTQAGPIWRRIATRMKQRVAGAEPRVVPFHDRLRGFDLIQSWEIFTDWSAEALIARERYGIPLAVMVWDNIPLNMERDSERREIKRRVVAGADLFIVHTERSRRMLAIEGAPAERVVKVRPGVDTELFSPGPVQRAQFGLTDDDFVILFVGWFLPRKGIEFLLFALYELLNSPEIEKHRVRLLLVGSGPGKDRVEGLIRRLGIGHACTFAGSLPYSRMPDAFRAADAFVLPSIATAEWQEQFGMSLIEAMACGAPVISTWSGAIPEIAGDAAILCQPNDFVALVDALRSLAGSFQRRRDLAEAGRARALSHFALPQFAAAISDAYERVLT